MVARKDTDAVGTDGERLVVRGDVRDDSFDGVDIGVVEALEREVRERVDHVAESELGVEIRPDLLHGAVVRFGERGADDDAHARNSQRTVKSVANAQTRGSSHS